MSEFTINILKTESSSNIIEAEIDPCICQEVPSATVITQVVEVKNNNKLLGLSKRRSRSLIYTNSKKVLQRKNSRVRFREPSFTVANPEQLEQTITNLIKKGSGFDETLKCIMDEKLIIEKTQETNQKTKK